MNEPLAAVSRDSTPTYVTGLPCFAVAPEVDMSRNTANLSLTIVCPSIGSNRYVWYLYRIN